MRVGYARCGQRLSFGLVSWAAEVLDAARVRISTSATRRRSSRGQASAKCRDFLSWERERASGETARSSEFVGRRVRTITKPQPKMSTAAAQATEFYATFTARLDSLDTSISSASTPAGLDAVVHQLIESRGILQSKDLEGHLSNRDRELYEKVSGGVDVRGGEV